MVSSVPAESGSATRESGTSVFVSIVVPVYNAMPYLTDLLSSLDAQTLDTSLFEAIFVDDGSTDNGGQVLDEYAAGREHVTVIHQENSGWAGKPRNVGMDSANGEYIFFVDSDDWLGAETLTRMRDFALAHDSDVVAPRLVPAGGRKGGGSTFAQTVIDAPLEHMLKTLMPQKMIRAELLRANNIRFREDKVRLEDGMALVKAYCAAHRNSILGDYEYYYIRARSDGANISMAPIDPASYTASLAHIATTLMEDVPDSDYAKDLVAGLFSRKGLKVYRGQRFLKYREAKRKGWIQAHREFLAEFLPDDLHRFEGIRREKVVCILNSDHDGLIRLARLEANEERSPVLESVEAEARYLKFSARVPNYVSKPVSLVAEQRKTKEQQRISLHSSDGQGADEQLIAAKLPLDGAQGLLDLSVLLADGRIKRIEFPQGVPETTHLGARVYRTANGYVSVDARQLRAGTLQRVMNRVGKVFGRSSKQ